MHVVATAGHVDHGKSTLIRALTGMEPDRFAEEQRRGMTIDLGYAWTTLPSGRQVAFVDVPGHERFIANMLAGVGPAPLVMLVVAADEGWMPQTEEHARAVASLRQAKVLLVVSKSDLGPQAGVTAAARTRLADLGVECIATIATDAHSGSGLDDLRAALDEAAQQAGQPEPCAPIRLWVDRAFTVRGAGTVVTGTLPAGTIHTGDTLLLTPAGREVVVRGLQSLGADIADATGPARVAVNLRGLPRGDVRRGMALVTPNGWTSTDVIDIVADRAVDVGRVATLHIGSAALPVRLRPLQNRAVRLHLREPLPLHVGDRVLVRDPATRALFGADVADVAPAPLRTRGSARATGAGLVVPSSADEELARRGISTASDLRAAGFSAPPQSSRRAGEHWVAEATWERLRSRLVVALQDSSVGYGVSIAALRRAIAAPSDDVVAALVAEMHGVECVDGRIRASGRAQPIAPGLQALLRQLDEHPFRAPDTADLADLHVVEADLAAAAGRQLLLKLTAGVYVHRNAEELAVSILMQLPQPFAVSDARNALASTRRTVVPLLEHLDAARRTRRLPDGRRVVVASAA